MDAQEYKRILAEHGRRVANRVAFASLSKEEQAAGGLDNFYACYGAEDGLPEHERKRPGNPANVFDPTGWNDLYHSHRTRLMMADSLLDQTSRDWPLWCVQQTPETFSALFEAYHDDEAYQKLDDEDKEFFASMTPADRVCLFIFMNGVFPSPGGRIPYESQAAEMYASLLGSKGNNQESEES
ncbi:hypothetical protein [Paraburkholderia sp. BL10I2N1]|uniref:hypothetical protein n=1 Tax=Paraburkholderia sp. BL10I2N1 TaxID=1938796 RepID=UPI00105EA292|nr:hypothetical protein [Paraburkholderia sp. BL10I2N1]TDN69081.1 hypothetical protein B0G77_2450 [Paraburkholderia sp. BL10I2N1]